MKTKIIYISGNELFEMSEIRAAFDEVREALGLDNETILFGVPVDSDNAVSVPESVSSEENQTMAIAEECDCVENVEHVDTIPTPQSIEIVDNVAEMPENTVAEEEKEEDISDVVIEEEVIIDEVIEPAQEEEQVSETNSNDTIIPILSLLGGKDEQNIQHHEEILSEEINKDTEQLSEELSSEDTAIEQKAIEPDVTMEDEAYIEQVSISDIADEEMPVKSTKTTIEELLESMTPLREDHNNIAMQEDTEQFVYDEIDISTKNDTDATLAQLASEFVENEDKIPQQKNETHGKIGKLKNILPFKKAKRDDSGLIGDLFGWAGIAANDEEFSIPGFFANAKKQGA